MALDHDIDLQSRVSAMLSMCELTNIRVSEFSCRRDRPIEAASVSLNSEVSYIVDAEQFGNRYQWQALLSGEDGETVAEIQATLIVEYDVIDGFEPDDEAAKAIAESTGYYASYPYVRELIQSGCSRLQLNPLVLGTLFPDASKPRSVSMPVSASE